MFKIQLAIFLCAVQILTEKCKGLSFIDLPSDSDDTDAKLNRMISERATKPIVKDEIEKKIERRLMSGTTRKGFMRSASSNPDDLDLEATDKYLKQKIAALITQTIRDISSKVKSVQPIKEAAREEAAYKAGFISSMVRKCRYMMNDLFNLAVKHRDNWKALQQLKVFEYIVHVNVDTTNLVRQLVEIHIQHLNSTSNDNKKRVVLL